MGNGKLKQARRAKGLTIRGLAQWLGVSASTVARWEEGQKPSGYAQRLLCTFFQCTATELGFGEEREESLMLLSMASADAGYVRLVLAAVPYWLEQGWLEVCERQVRGGVELMRRQEASEELARLLGFQGEVWWRMGQYEQAKAAYEEGLWIAEMLRNEACVHEAEAAMAWVCCLCGKDEEARWYLARARGAGVPGRLLLKTQGILAWRRRDYQQAKKCYEKGATEASERGERMLLYGLLAEVELALGESARAVEFFERALTEVQEYGKVFEQLCVRRSESKCLVEMQQDTKKNRNSRKRERCSQRRESKEQKVGRETFGDHIDEGLDSFCSSWYQ